MEKEQYKKDAVQYRISYFSMFGELIVKSYQCKISCIQKKKIIRYCQSIINSGGIIDQSEMEQYVENIMRPYFENLENLNRQYTASKEIKLVSEYDLYQIKKIYRRIVKKLHPDVNPETQSDETLMNLWNRVCNAYCGNRKEDLEELEILVDKYLDNNEAEIHIQNIDEKIQKLEKEINAIVTTVPYTYKYILDDPEQIKQKKDELNREINEYETYAKELDEVISAFPIQNMMS